MLIDANNHFGILPDKNKVFSSLILGNLHCLYSSNEYLSFVISLSIKTLSSFSIKWYQSVFYLLFIFFIPLDFNSLQIPHNT